MNLVNLEASRIRKENLALQRLRLVTTRAMSPLDDTDLDEYTALIVRFEDFCHDEEKLMKQLALVRMKKDEMWLRIQRVHERRVK